MILFSDRHVCWPKDRVSIPVLFKRLDNGNIKDCQPAFQWMSKVSDIYLKNMSINLSYTNEQHENIFHKICCFKNSDILPLIISKCENIDAKEKHGETILHRACKVGNPKNVEIILKNGAKIDSLTKKKETPLMYACRHNPSVDLLKVLLKYNPKLDLINKKNESALDVLRNNKKASNCVKLLHPMNRQY